MNKLLQQYELPRPWRYGRWFGHGSVDVVECGNGLLLVADYSRNKGGLFSSRITPEIVWQHYPLHFRIAYAWAAPLHQVAKVLEFQPQHQSFQ